MRNKKRVENYRITLEAQGNKVEDRASLLWAHLTIRKGMERG
jgi:hypothetical protein